jgi:hypothetical protein
VHVLEFDVPFLAPGSDPGLRRQAVAILDAHARTLRGIEPKCRVSPGREPTRVRFQFPHAFAPDSDLGANAEVLGPALMECLCDLDLAFLTHAWKSGTPAVPLYQSPVTYDRTLVWDTVPALYRRGYGDCKSLSAARVAEYRLGGQEARPFFRFVPPDQSDTGQFCYHILVLGPYGWEDPSKHKGMGASEWAYFTASGKRAA